MILLVAIGIVVAGILDLLLLFAAVGAAVTWIYQSAFAIPSAGAANTFWTFAWACVIVGVIDLVLAAIVSDSLPWNN
jgi:hypothetical protein